MVTCQLSRIMEDKPVAVVTASTAGIGLSAAMALAKNNMHVIVSSRKAENVSQAVALINGAYGPEAASGIPCQVGDKANREALVEFAAARSDNIRALVLNAAVSTTHGPILNISEDQWDKMFDINIKAAFFLVKEFRHMFKPGSSVTFITSIAAYNPIPGLGAYSITKTAILGMCKSLSVEFAREGIRVNAVAPGLIQTKFSEMLWKHNDEGEGEATESSKISKFVHIPMGRIGKPNDIGGVVAFLVSKDAAYITGETIVAAGGITSKL